MNVYSLATSIVPSHPTSSLLSSLSTSSNFNEASSTSRTLNSYDNLLGCTPASHMEALDPLVTVEPLLPATRSHPGPAYESGEGVSQNFLAGKYAYNTNISLPVMYTTINSPFSASSNTPTHSTSPGCLPASLMEAPNPLVTVEPLLPAIPSHPGPVYEFGEGVFQPVFAGKYTCNEGISLSVTSDDSSNVVITPSCSGSHRPNTEASGVEECTSLITVSTPSQDSNIDLRSRQGIELNNFSVYYQNVRGLRTKINKLRLMLTSCDYDVIVFTETWLREDISSAEVSTEYTIFRGDRSTLTSKHTRGGGVLIAVKNHLRCEAVPLLNVEKLEQAAVCIRSKARSLYIITVYLPPNSLADLYATHADAVQYITNQASEADIVLSLGDFNLPKLCWQLDDEINGYIPSNIASEQDQSLLETMFSAGLRQINSYVNTNGNLLDLVFVNFPEQIDIIEPPTPLLPVDNHHKPFILLIEVSDDQLVSSDSLFEPSYDFTMCDYQQVKAALAVIEWDDLLGFGTIDDAVTAFYNKLAVIFNDYVPRKRRSFNSMLNKPWWTPELRNFRNVLRKARRRYFLTKSECDLTTLREIESSYKAVLLSTYEAYIAEIQTNVKLNPSRFWDFVKKRKSSARIPCNVSFNDTYASSNAEAADLFSMFFESVFSKASPVPRQNCFAHITTQNINMPIIQFSPNEVLIAINNLDSKKGPGTDDIPPLFLMNCSTELAAPITSLFNRSLREKTYPTAWKKAFIVPIHKSGNINRVCNYRGVSILCCLSKVFEKLMHDIMYAASSSSTVLHRNPDT